MIRHDKGRTREKTENTLFCMGLFAKRRFSSNLKSIEDIERGMRMRMWMWMRMSVCVCVCVRVCVRVRV